MRQFEQMKVRLGGKTPRAAARLRHLAPEAKRNHSSSVAQQIILGVDPSLRGTGYGVIKLAKPFPETLAHGTISCPGLGNARAALQKFPGHCAKCCANISRLSVSIEGLFFAQNLQTAIIMGEARGAAMAAMAEAGMEFLRSPRAK